MKEINYSLQALIISQTIANENFEFTKQYIKEQFDIALHTKLETKYKEQYGELNRKLKRKLEKEKDEQYNNFLRSFKNYEEVTRKMVSHFDNWIPENLDKIITKTSDKIEKELKKI